MRTVVRYAVMAVLLGTQTGVQSLSAATANFAAPEQTGPIALSASNSRTPCIPALWPVELVLDTDLGSKISKTGDSFAFHLANPIVVDGREIVQAGASGQGEVIHAKKAGGSGTAGELVLAARFLVVGSRHLRLRSFRIADKPSDAVGKVIAFTAASTISPVPVALIGFAVTGRNNFFPKGTVALAKTAEQFTAPDVDGIDPSPEPTNPPTNLTGGT